MWQAKPSTGKGRPRRRLLRAAGALAAGVMLVLGTAAQGSAAPLYPAPDPDPFFAEPPDLAQKQPGDVLAVRQMPPLPMFPDTTVTVVRFRSTNSTGTPIAATTTVLTPRSHRKDGPLLSLQHIINALGAKCSVSRVLYTTDPDLMVREAPAWNVLLQRGWSIALPDHLARNSPTAQRYWVARSPWTVSARSNGSVSSRSGTARCRWWAIPAAGWPPPGRRPCSRPTHRS